MKFTIVSYMKGMNNNNRIAIGITFRLTTTAYDFYPTKHAPARLLHVMLHKVVPARLVSLSQPSANGDKRSAYG